MLNVALNIMCVVEVEGDVKCTFWIQIGTGLA